MASNRVKTRELKSGEIIAYSESAIRNNASAVEYCRTSMAALSGSTAGRSSNIWLTGKGSTNFHCSFRNHGTDWHFRISLLFGGRLWTVVFVVAQVRIELAKVFH